MVWEEEVGSGKKLHSVFITEIFWLAAARGSELYTRIVDNRAVTPSSRLQFIESFHALYTNTAIEVEKVDKKIVDEVEKEFSITKFRDEKELIKLINLWQHYSRAIQKSKLMELIKESTMVRDSYDKD